MSKSYKHYETHDFYCLYCGKKSLPLMRKQNHKHEKFHRKVLFCPHCGQVVNHIEITNDEERNWFIEHFEAGDFTSEAIRSIEFERLRSCYI